jgi:hypothetical protein
VVEAETIDPHTVAGEMLALGADRNDQLVTFFAGERTLFPAGRLADLAPSAAPGQYGVARLVQKTGRPFA